MRGFHWGRRQFTEGINMAKIEFVVHRLYNKNQSEWEDCIDHLRTRYKGQVEDGSGDYTTSVDKGESTSEWHLLYSYSSDVDNPDVYDLADDWRAYVSDNLSQRKWRVHGLVVDWHEMNSDDEGYDMSGAGGLAVTGSANNYNGSTFWASNPRGTVHEATHTMMAWEHFHHNMGRQDDQGHTTAMGAAWDRGCSYYEFLQQPDIEHGTTKLGFRSVQAVREFRDNETYVSGYRDCCYNVDNDPCNSP